MSVIHTVPFSFSTKYLLPSYATTKTSPAMRLASNKLRVTKFQWNNAFRSLRRAYATPITSSATSTSTSNTTTTDTKGLSDPIAYCSDLVRKQDYESFLVSQFWLKELRGSYLAIKAFSVELATVQDHVSNTMIGKMRMQFWRDAIKDISNGKPPRHPIALGLHEAFQKANLQPYHFKRIIDARDAELEHQSYQTIDHLTAHAESTSSTLLYLLLSLLNLSSSHALSHASSHLGTAQTITTLLRALPYHSKSGRMVIPAEITSKYGVSQEDVFRNGPNAKGIEDAVFEFATLANDHLITARSMLKEEGFGGKVPGVALPIFLAGVPVTNFLGRLEKANFNAFDPKLQLRDWKLPWQIYKNYYQRNL